MSDKKEESPKPEKKRVPKQNLSENMQSALITFGFFGTMIGVFSAVVHFENKSKEQDGLYLEMHQDSVIYKPIQLDSISHYLGQNVAIAGEPAAMDFSENTIVSLYDKNVSPHVVQVKTSKRWWDGNYENEHEIMKLSLLEEIIDKDNQKITVFGNIGLGYTHTNTVKHTKIASYCLHADFIEIAGTKYVVPTRKHLSQ